MNQAETFEWMRQEIERLTAALEKARGLLDQASHWHDRPYNLQHANGSEEIIRGGCGCDFCREVRVLAALGEP